AGGAPSFKNYRTPGTKMPYPASLCTSVNEEVVHGIPGKRVLKEGDIVGLDIGMQFKGFFTDMAVTLPVGQVSHDVGELLRTAKKALALGIAEACSGQKTGDIGEAVQTFVEKKGYGVVRELVGHGVGASVHEDPEIPNWGRKNSGIPLKPGMVIAIEPMITIGSPALEVSPDGWVWRTKSGKPSAHFEHTVLITASAPEIITK
ncbi:MAG: type I methionyl aminopeptidase, partial [Candidatus Ryanbacteria bacterium]|nr:type I methionyl aminopeptidase [Candidatus Ryanbacteria bacterium]